jgi:hypothetical protein
MLFQVAKMTNTNGEAFQITVVGKTGSENFRGFFIQARFVQITVNIMASNRVTEYTVLRFLTVSITCPKLTLS